MDKQITDRRIRKTKKLLRNTLVELMNEKSLDNITVKDLTKKADLNRGTFYLHYRDIFDLLEQSQIEMLQEMSEILRKIDHSVFIEYDSKNKPYPPLVELFEWFRNNLNFCKALMGPNGGISFLERTKTVIENEFYKKQNKIDGKNSNVAFSEYFYAYIIFGFLGIIKQWFESDASIPPKEMAQILIRIALNGFQTGIVSRNPQKSPNWLISPDIFKPV
ncbi:MAG: tetr (putative transcriptional regulator) [Firmicutes bacterium]|nr:tetr (putative transcriptional regulator) [Bacillota bacterium]